MADRTLVVTKAWERASGQLRPVGWWRLGETAGTNADDAGPNGYDGTYTGTYTLNQTSLVASDANPSVQLSGGYVTLGDVAALEFVNTAPFSIVCWVNHTPDATVRRLFEKMNTGGYRLTSQSGTNGLKFLRVDSGGASDTCQGGPLTAANKMVVATYDGSNMRLYVDGVQTGSTQASTRNLPATTNPAVIGASSTFGTTLTGKMDEVMLVDRALSAGEIADLYATATVTDLIQSVTRRSLRITQKGYASIATFGAEIHGLKGRRYVPAEAEVTLTDTDSSVMFAGIIRQKKKRMVDGQNRYVIDVVGQDYTSLLMDDVVDDANGLRVTAESDKQRITWLLSTYGTKGVTVGAEVQTLIAAMPLDSGGNPTQDFRGKSLADAIKMICQLSGGMFYVDYQKKLHYALLETTVAGFGFSDTPNDATTFGYHSLEMPDDTVSLRNAVYVQGNGVADWRTDEASIRAFGRREAGITNAQITTTDQLNDAGDAFLKDNAWPKQTGSLKTYKRGIVPGMQFALTNALWGVQGATWTCQEISVDLSGPQAVYTIRFGTEPSNLVSVIGSSSSAVQTAIDLGNAALAQGADTDAPGDPTVATVTTSVQTDTTGEQVIVMTVGVTHGSHTGDLWGTWVEVTGQYTGSEGSEVPVWTSPMSQVVGADQTYAVFTGLKANSLYWIRARSEDSSANASANALYASNPVTTTGDTTPPSTVTALDAIGIPSGLIVSYGWPGDTDVDFVTVEVAPDDGGVPGTWSSVGDYKATVVSVEGLAPTSLYWVRATATDTSGNVGATATMVTSVMTGAIGPDSFGANKITAAQIDTSTLTADMIQAGTYRARPGESGWAQGFVVQNASGVDLGTWDEDGIIVRDPTAPTTRWAQLNAGSLKITNNGGGSWAVEMTPDGFRGESIRLGTLPGGHNVVMNSGFELAPGVASATWAWNVQADWTGTSVSNDNVTVGANDLTTSIAY